MAFEVLPEDVLEELSYYGVDIESLRLTTDVNRSIDTIVASNSYWKKKTESVVGHDLDEIRSNNWRAIYQDLNSDVTSNADVVKIWVQYKPEKFLYKLLYKASKLNYPQVVRVLLDNGIDPSQEYDKALRLASENNSVDVLRLLLRDPRVNPGRGTIMGDLHPLVEAARAGYTEVVRLLLEDGRTNPAVNNSMALVMAANAGRTEVVRLLLENGRADPSANNSKALELAVLYDRVDVIRLLLEDGRVDPNVDDNKIMKLAYNKKRKNTEVLRLLAPYLQNV